MLWSNELVEFKTLWSPPALHLWIIAEVCERGGDDRSIIIVCKSMSILVLCTSSWVLIIFFTKKLANPSLGIVMSWQIFSPVILEAIDSQQVGQQNRSLLSWQYMKQLLYLLQRKHCDLALSVIYAIFPPHDAWSRRARCTSCLCTKACEFLHRGCEFL